MEHACDVHYSMKMRSPCLLRNTDPKEEEVFPGRQAQSAAISTAASREDYKVCRERRRSCPAIAAASKKGPLVAALSR
jgi:hypothetical protein